MADASADAGSKRPRILVIEDHTPTRLAMGKLIRQAGADVVTARDGEEGLKYLMTQRFDVLLTDLRMPVMDGFELLQHCENFPRVIARRGWSPSAANTRQASFTVSRFSSCPSRSVFPRCWM